MSDQSYPPLRRDVRTEPRADRSAPYILHTVAWGDVAIGDYDMVEWHGVRFLVQTDQEEYGDTSWASAWGGRFVAKLDAWALEERIPCTEQEYAQRMLAGKIDALYIDQRGTLYAEICTGIVEVVWLPFDDSPSYRLHRGYPRPDGYTDAFSAGFSPGQGVIHCQPCTQFFDEVVGDVSQLVVVRPGSDLDMEVWGEVFK